MASAGKVVEGRLRQAFAHCAQQVRLNDYEHYLCTLHLPGAQGAAAIALRALNVETSSLAERVKEPRLALIRMVWWRDAVEAAMQGKVQEHPVLEALGAVSAAQQLSRPWVDRFLQARIDDLKREIPVRSIDALEEYCESTSSVLLYLTLQASGVQSVAADHAASHLGKAQGLTTLLRATPRHSALRRSYLPLETLAKHGVPQEELYAGRSSSGLADAVFEVASAAKGHLDTARGMAESLPKEAIRLMLPAVPAAVYLKELERTNFNIFDPALHRGVCGVSPLHLQLKIWQHRLWGTY